MQPLRVRDIRPGRASDAYGVPRINPRIRMRTLITAAAVSALALSSAPAWAQHARPGLRADIREDVADRREDRRHGI